MHAGQAGRFSRARISSSFRRLDAALPIAVKLVLPVLLLAGASGGILALTVYRSEVNRIRGDYREYGFLVGEAVRSAVASDGGAARPSSDVTDVQRQIDALVQLEPSILRIDLIDVNGRASTIAASTDHSRIGTSENDATDLADEMRAARTGQIVSHDDSVGRVTAVHLTVPFKVAAGPPLIVAVHLSATERDRALAGLLRNFELGVGSAAVLAVAVLVIGLRTLIFRRIRMVLRFADRLQAGDLAARIEHAGLADPRDEMLRLASRFNGMAASIEQLHAEVQEAATTDHLTGLYNRRFVMDTLEREIARARRNDEPLCVMMADLDGLKQINDALGHQAGDQAIRCSAEALREALRATDYAARIGGDELAAVLPNCDIQGLSWVMDRLQRSGACEAADARMTYTLSAGGAVLGANDNADTLLARADAALYAAKRAGKSRSRIAA